MRNHNNTAVVWYPGKGLRTRSCQTTEYPQGYKRHTTVSKEAHTRNFNNWARHIREQVMLMAGDGNNQVDEAKALLLQPVKSKF